jgi:hypothetical protein
MIKNFNLFKESVDSEFKIHKICKEYNIKNYTINDDLSIDVDGKVDISNKDLKYLPLKFGRVSGSFYCDNNKLTSLEFCPYWVGGHFHCNDNKLTSLEFCPKFVNNRTFFCYNNRLITLKHLPDNLEYIYFNNNKIWSFKGIPDSFRGELKCRLNPIEHIWNLFESSKDIEFLNDCDVIREPQNHRRKPIIVLERLNFFLETIGKPPVEKVDGYINI